MEYLCPKWDGLRYMKLFVVLFQSAVNALEIFQILLFKGVTLASFLQLSYSWIRLIMSFHFGFYFSKHLTLNSAT